MKKIYILLVAILVTSFSFAQGSEDFANSNAPAGYGDGNFVGNNGVTWTYVAGRESTDAATGGNTYGSPALPALMLRRVSSGSKVTSSPVAGGIADFSVNLYRGFTSTSADRQVELFVNGVSYGMSTGFTDETEHTFTVTGINIAGDVIIELRSTTSKQTVVDNISWTAYAGAAVPALAITSPVNGDVVSTGDVTVNYAISNFNVASAGNGDGHFHWELDGSGNSTPVYSDTGVLQLTGLSVGEHTLFMDLRDDAHASLSPVVEATVTFTVQGYTQVADIAALRLGTIGDSYELMGEAFINYAQTYRHQKWIQDGSAAILIDDNVNNTNVITAGDRGDGLTGLRGTLDEYNGMLQFVPSIDATVVSPSTLTITPMAVTLADISSMGNNYEGQLVMVQNVVLSDWDDAGSGAADGTFQNGKNYPIADAVNRGGSLVFFRTNFYNVDYITTSLPAGAQTIVGLVGERSGDGAFFIAARDMADMAVASVSNNTIDGFAMYPNPVNGVLNITTAQNLDKNVQIFNILGKQVLAQTISANTINVSKLNAGIYLIKVEEAGNVVTSKLVVR